MELEEYASSSKKLKVGEEKYSPQSLCFSALVVDADATVRKIYSAMLKSLGFESEVVTNGKEAVDIFRAGTNFHIVFIDVEMRAVNGIEATKELRAMGVKSKIVGMISHDVEPKKKESFMLAGLDVCYTKPLTAARILSLKDDLRKN